MSHAVLIDIDLTSGKRYVSNIDLYVSDANYLTDEWGRHLTDADGNYLTDEGTGADVYYKKSLKNAPTITKSLPNDSSGIISERSITLEITDNPDTADTTWNYIIANEEIRGREIKIYRYTDGLQVFSCWGIIQGYSYGDYLTLDISIFDNDSLEVDLPKHTITADRFTSTALDAGKTINIPFGHCIDVPLWNIQNDTVNDYYDYLIGYGTIQGAWVDHANNRGVRREGVLVNTSEYTVYDGSQVSPFPGYAFIRFAVEQRGFSGQMLTLTADIKGLELGGSTAERNFANVIYHLLTNSTWGLGQSANSASFAEAAAHLSTDFLCDGFISSVRQAGDILNDLLLSCLGRLGRNVYGERTLAIMQAGSSVASYGCNDGHYNNAETIQKYGQGASDVPKGITVKYGKEPGSTDYAYEITLTAFSGFGIDSEYSFPFIGDSGTAKRVGSFLRNLPVHSDTFVEAKLAPREFRDRKEYDVITYTDPRRNISGDWIIWELTTNNRDEYRALLRKYSASIFSQETISTPTTLVISGDENDLNAWVGNMTVGNSNADAASVLVKEGGHIATDETPASNGGVYIDHEGIVIYRDDGSVFLKADVPSDLFTLDGEAIIGSAWIQTAMIDDLQVNTAKIANLAVGTGKIINNAVSIREFSESSTGWSGSGCGSDTILLSDTIVIDEIPASGSATVIALGTITEKTRDDCNTMAGFKIYTGTNTSATPKKVFYRTDDSGSAFYFLSGYGGTDTLVFQHTITMMGAVSITSTGTYTITLEWCGLSPASVEQASMVLLGVKK